VRLPLSHFGSFSILLRVSNLVKSGMSSLHLFTDFVSLSVSFKLMTLVDAFWPSVRSVTAVRFESTYIMTVPFRVSSSVCNTCVR